MIVSDINSGIDPCPSHLVLKQAMLSFEAYKFKIKIKRIKRGAVCLKKEQGCILLKKKNDLFGTPFELLLDNNH